MAVAALLQILVEEVQSPGDDSMSHGDWISLLSAFASIVAIAVGLWQFNRTLSQARTDRQDDASVARQLRLDDAAESRQLRLEDAQVEREEKLEEARKKWLTSIIIQPSLPVIISFYDKIILMTMSSLEELSQANATQAANSAQMRNMRILKAGIINSLKQDFDHSFITLVASQNHHFGQKLRTALNDLEDLIADTLGKIDYSQVDSLTLNEQLYVHKSKFFSILYKEVQQESR